MTIMGTSENIMRFSTIFKKLCKCENYEPWVVQILGNAFLTRLLNSIVDYDSFVASIMAVVLWSFTIFHYKPRPPQVIKTLI